ncbi:MAG TPA: hypothetical protein VF498_04490 [Anaerolineales bacterium]
MQILSYDDDLPQEPKRGPSSAMIWNVLTILVLLSVTGVLGLFLTISANPQSAFNPFPPPTLPAAVVLPTVTPTPLGLLPPTWTPLPTLEPTATFTPRPTGTLPPTSTSFSLVTPSVTPKPTKVPGGMPYVVQKGSPVAIANIYHPDQGCNWAGVAGQVFDLKGAALRGMQVQLGGSLGGTPIPQGYPTLTGLLPYAAGYYEFTLATYPIASRATLWVQLVDQAGAPLSEKIYFDTYDDCTKNLILVNIKQIR